MSVRYVIVIGVGILAVAGLVFGVRRGSLPVEEFQTAVVVRGDIVREVRVTGVVIAARSAALSFAKGGTVASINYGVGDMVLAGAVIASLKSGSLSASRQEASASLEAAQAELARLKRGPTIEDKAVADANVVKAAVALDEARAVLARQIREAFAATEAAVFNKVDQAFSNPRVFPQLRVVGVDGQLRADVETDRRRVETALNAWRVLVIAGAQEELLSARTNVEGYLSFIFSFMASVSDVLSGATTGGVVTQAVLDGWITDVAAARTTVDAERAAIAGAHEDVLTAEASLFLEERKRDLAYAPTTPEQIAVQMARVSEAEAKVARITAEIEDTLLRMPFTGVIGKIDLRVGENVSAAAAVARVQTAGFELEAFIPEIDIESMAPGVPARVTLDAFGGRDEFEAAVVSIDRAATIKEGVATYKTLLRFARQDPRIRTGMSANIDIKTGEAFGILIIPGRAVLRRGDLDVVRILDDEGAAQEVVVQTGLRGTFGDIEIIGGLFEGDTIITRLP